MRIGIAFLFGSEYRQFWISGLVERLRTEGADIAVVTRQEMASQVSALFTDGERVERLPAVGATTFARVMTDMFSFYCQNKLGFKYVDRKPPWRRRLFRYLSVRLLTIKWLRAVVTEAVQGNSDGIALEVESYDCILVSVPGVEIASLAAFRRRGALIVLVVHTFKDLPVIGALQQLYDAIVVWDSEMAESLAAECPSARICVGGNLELFPGVRSRAAEHGERSDKVRYVYIAAAPWVIRNEPLVLKQLLEVMPLRCELIVRINPMDDTSTWANMFAADSRVSTVTPDWKWLPELNLNVASKEDSKVLSDIISASSCVIGFPSTVILEAAVLNTPFINLLMTDIEGVVHLNAPREFWESPACRYLRGFPMVYPVDSVTGFAATINDDAIFSRSVGARQLPIWGETAVEASAAVVRRLIGDRERICP